MPCALSASRKTSVIASFYPSAPVETKNTQFERFIANLGCQVPLGLPTVSHPQDEPTERHKAPLQVTPTFCTPETWDADYSDLIVGSRQAFSGIQECSM
jgi:hypothetical protein